jgi:hypothetical protein
MVRALRLKIRHTSWIEYRRGSVAGDIKAAASAVPVGKDLWEKELLMTTSG